jgi:RNase P subunit RPR2
MKPMDQKTPQMKKVIDDIFPGTLEAIDKHLCPLCRSPINPERDFRDTLSEKEYYISGMCQNCQDRVF